MRRRARVGGGVGGSGLEEGIDLTEGWGFLKNYIHLSWGVVEVFIMESGVDKESPS